MTKVKNEATSTQPIESLTREPVIALIGLPNAGKSALLNRLIGERKAIVADEEHTTRDVNLGSDTWDGYDLNFVDTGGLVPNPSDLIQKLVQITSWTAIAKADVIVWLIDRKTNPEVFTTQMLQKIWKLNKPLIIAISKVDNPQNEKNISEYAMLGGNDFVNFSANSGYGINDLLDAVVRIIEQKGFVRNSKEGIVEAKPKPKGKKNTIKEVIAEGNYYITRDIEKNGDNLYKLVTKSGQTIKDITRSVPENNQETEEEKRQREEEFEYDESLDGLEQEANSKPKILLLGKPNVGKSTLINTLFGEEKQIVSEIAGTTLSINDYDYTAKNGRVYSFIDSAGIRKKGSRILGAETFATFRTIEAAYSCDAILFILDASVDISHQDQVVGGICKESHKGLIILANKADLISSEQRKNWQTQLFKKFEFLKSEDVLFISASEATNIPEIFTRLDDILDRRNTEIPTEELRKLFNYLMKQKKPPKLATKKKAVCYDILQTKAKPPTFELLVKDKETIHWSYLRFLENIIRKQFKLNNTGVKVKITEVFKKNVLD